MRRTGVVVVTVMLATAAWIAPLATGVRASDPGVDISELRGSGAPSPIRCGLCVGAVIGLSSMPFGPVLSFFDRGGYGFGLCVRWCSAS